MAGSYNHIVNDNGNFVTNEKFVGMIENLGDAYEMAEEMYGMIWYIASLSPNMVRQNEPEELVEMARRNYKIGLDVAKTNTRKKKHDGR